MRRTHALHRRNTPVRLVAMTASQSSGFMRTSSVSRVMAALLTRIVGSSPALSSSPTSASTEAAFPASSTAPRPLHPCDASAALKRAAPSALVDVPITRAPAPPRVSAMAWPMPREAPVTSATSFSSMGTPSGRRECRFKGRRVLQRQKIQVRTPLDPAVQAREHLARPAFDHLRDSRAHRAQRVRPAHGVRQLAYQQLADLAGPLVRAGTYGADVADTWRAHLWRAQPLLEALGRAAAETGVRGHA